MTTPKPTAGKLDAKTLRHMSRLLKRRARSLYSKGNGMASDQVAAFHFHSEAEQTLLLAKAIESRGKGKVRK